MSNIAIILVDLERGRFGHRVSLREELAGQSVLQHTLDRVARIDGIDRIVLLHPDSQSLTGAYETAAIATRISTMSMQTRPGDAWLRSVIDSGRKWSLTAWRGGIGGMTVYDELLPAYAIQCAVQEHHAESAVVLRGDWCCIDPELASKQLKLHRSAPEAMKIIFSQAPPGLGPLVIHHTLVAELVEHSATVANLLGYNPRKPVIDPVCKDVNVPIPATVRDQYRRFIYDTPRAIDHLRAIADRLGDRFSCADAVEITNTSRAVETEQPWRQFERLPQQFTIELSPRRAVNGPIIPQHYIDLERPDMDASTIDTLLEQLSAPIGRDAHPADTSVLFGGLGDPLLHDSWFSVLERATQSGLLGVGIETDLLVDADAIDRLASLPLDVISLRLNADTAETYHRLMGIDGYAKVMENLQSLFKHRNANRQSGKGFQGWIVPRLVKVADNLADLETFFERWTTVCGWAVVDRALTGRGLIPDFSPVPMEVPRPPDRPINLCRQKHRLTVLSDGRLCLCGQDWLGRLSPGSFTQRPLSELWQGVISLADEPHAGSVVCPACAEWLEAQCRLQASASTAD